MCAREKNKSRITHRVVIFLLEACPDLLCFNNRMSE